MRKDWFMHPPFNCWNANIVDQIAYLVERANEPDEVVWKAIKRCPPKGGWSAEAKAFVYAAYQYSDKRRRKDTPQ